MKLVGVMFWVNLTGAIFNILALNFISVIPFLRPAWPWFAMGAVAFMVGSVANYYALPKGVR